MDKFKGFDNPITAQRIGPDYDYEETLMVETVGNAEMTMSKERKRYPLRQKMMLASSIPTPDDNIVPESNVYP